jgi:hypothetical protein
MDQLLTVLIAVSYVVGPLSLGAMVYVGWRLIQDHQQKRRERP